MRATFRLVLVLAAVPHLPCADFATAQTYVVDFDTDAAGIAMTAGLTDLRTYQPYEHLFGVGSGMHLATNSPGSNPLNLYDSEGVGGADDDLERNSDPQNPGVWAGGNATDAIMHNLLIINTNTDIALPNDRAGGGLIILRFDVPLVDFAFEFADMDAASGADIVFTDRTTGATHRIPFTAFESGSVHTVPDTAFSNRSANLITGIEASELPGMDQFDEVVFELRSSGGIGSIAFTVVPEPPAAPVLVVAGMATALRRRRK